MNYAEFCQILYPFRNGISSQSQFVSLMFKYAGCTEKRASDTYKALYTGERELSIKVRQTIPSFNIINSIEFFNRFLTKNDLSSLFLELKINEAKQSRQALNHTLALVFKSFIEDDSPSFNFNNIYNEILNDPGEKYTLAPQGSDWDYINELQNKCPICGENLIVRSGAGTIRNYKLAYIFPKNLEAFDEISFTTIAPKPANLDSYENTICLCNSCFNKYQNDRDENTYLKLVKAKLSAINTSKEKGEIDEVSIDDSIEYVLGVLSNIKTISKLTPLAYDAYKVDEKIPPTEDFTFNKDVKDNVVTYYNYIEELLEKYEVKTNGGSTNLASQIKTLSNIYMKTHSKQDVVEMLINELNNKVGGEGKYRSACRLIVHYFIQHCEVLTNEIPE